MQQMIARMAAKHYDRHNNEVTIIDGDEEEPHPPARRVRIPPNTTTAVLQHRVGPNWVNVPGVAAITLANVTAFVNFINNNAFTANHRDVLTNSASWRAFYNVTPRVLTYLNHAGGPLAPAPMGHTVACYDCGLVLPLRNITIDHQRPQGGNQYEPVCKVFRAMGLTIDGPAGPKGTHYLAAQRVAVGGLLSANAGTLQAKYTLNDVGTIYYTLADWCGVLGTLQTACMNHIVNLRPLCNACNTPNRNVRHF